MKETALLRFVLTVFCLPILSACSWLQPAPAPKPQTITVTKDRLIHSELPTLFLQHCELPATAKPFDGMTLGEALDSYRQALITLRECNSRLKHIAEAEKRRQALTEKPDDSNSTEGAAR